MRLFKDIFEETGKQNGVIYTGGYAQDVDLSIPLSENVDDEIRGVREISYKQVKDYCEEAATYIVQNNGCEPDDSDMITVYRMKTRFYDTENRNYEIFVPNWWD